MAKSDNVKRILIFHEEGYDYYEKKITRFLEESDSIMSNCIDRAGRSDKKYLKTLNEVFDVLDTLDFRRCIRSGHTEVNVEYWRELSNLSDLTKMRDTFIRDVKMVNKQLQIHSIKVQDPTI